jgi:hypothetical protein
VLARPTGASIRARRDLRPTARTTGPEWRSGLEDVVPACPFGTVAFFAAVSDGDGGFGPAPALPLATGFLTLGSVAGLALIPSTVSSRICRGPPCTAAASRPPRDHNAVPAALGDHLEPARLPALIV